MNIRKLSKYDKEYLARNLNTSVETLAALAKDEDSYVRLGVASNPNSPVGTLATLAKDDYWRVRCYVAENANSTVEILAAILQLELRGNWRRGILDGIFNHRNATDTIKAIIKTVLTPHL